MKNQSTIKFYNKKYQVMTLNLKKQFLSEPKIKSLSQERQAELYTYFLKNLSLKLHKFYQGKLKTSVKVPLTNKDFFDIWYTPGVSGISLETKKDQQNSFFYTTRANRVAIVTDSTRVLGDGDCGPTYELFRRIRSRTSMYR